MKFSFPTFALLLILSMSISCMSVHDYAIKYNPALTTEPTEDTEVKTSVPGELHLPSEQCEFFRNQLVYGAEAAQEHIWWVWAFPGYWPLHILTFYIFPIDQTQTANKVIEAAQKMEIAYQTNDAEFLTTCSSLFEQADIGPIFATENPFVEPTP